MLRGAGPAAACFRHDHDQRPHRASTAVSEQHCALLQSLHVLFALYLEFRHNPAFQHLAAFEAAAAEQPGGAVAAAGAADGA